MTDGMKKLEHIIIGCLLGVVIVDGLHIWATDNYRLFQTLIFLLLLFTNAIIAWIEYFEGVDK